MLRLTALLLILCSCSMGVIKSGGEKSYVYDSTVRYKSDELRELASKVVTTSKRNPPKGELAELFGNETRPIKKVGIIIFETEVQPTRSGLAGKNKIYLSEQGKQILTESMLNIWEQSFEVLGPEVNYIPTTKIREAVSFKNYGSSQDDFVKSQRTSIPPDDIFFLESGKKTTSETVLNARGMRDMSFALVPAYELMGGPKWSEHNKHFVNDVAKELGLDAVIIVMSKVSWSAAHTDKHSGEVFREEIKLEINSSILVPLHLYHSRLEDIGIKEKPRVTLCYRSYESQLKIPAMISPPSSEKRFSYIEHELLSPMMKSYKDLAQMIIINMLSDIKKTW